MKYFSFLALNNLIIRIASFLIICRPEREFVEIGRDRYRHVWFGGEASCVGAYHWASSLTATINISMVQHQARRLDGCLVAAFGYYGHHSCNPNNWVHLGGPHPPSLGCTDDVNTGNTVTAASNRRRRSTFPRLNNVWQYHRSHQGRGSVEPKMMLIKLEILKFVEIKSISYM